MRGLFSFPDPVNETSARLVAGGVAVFAVFTVAFQQGWLLPVLAYGFVARVLTGPTLSPLGLLATRVVTPRLRVGHRYSPGPAKRFAQAIGAAFTVTASLLEAAFGLCVGCRAFYLGMQLGLVPPHVCEDCARILAADRALTSNP